MTIQRDQVVATRDRIAAMPRRPVRDMEGVQERTLWSSGVQVSGVMELAAGARMPEHVHEDHSHHVWVVEGSVEILGELLVPGSYAHVPAGVSHEVAAGDRGCTLFYVFM